MRGSKSTSRGRRLRFSHEGGSPRIIAPEPYRKEFLASKQLTEAKVLRAAQTFAPETLFVEGNVCSRFPGNAIRSRRCVSP